MKEKSDAQLLRDYAEHGSETAFGEIVTRYTDFVYSAALRQVNSGNPAADISQKVFVDLAHKAKSLGGRLAAEASLAGWLHRATRFASLNHLRDIRRQRTNEKQAMEQLLTNSEPSVDWEQIRPLLDEALDGLDDEDREALLLRYFKNQDFRAVGSALGVSDDAAQKRVSRAVERLREFFSKRKITIGASGLAVLISANAVQSAPVGLAAAISNAAVLAGTTVSTSTAIATTKVIAMTTLQKTIIGAVVAAAVGTGVFGAHQAAQLRDRVQTLQHQQAPLDQQIRELQRERDEATNRLAGLVAENEQLQSSSNETELLKLRGEVGVLRERNNELDQLVSGMQAATKRSQLEYSTNLVSREIWGFAGYDTPEAAIQSCLWAKSSGNEKLWLASISTNMADWLTNGYVKGNSDQERSQFLINQTKSWTGFRILREFPISDNTVLIQQELTFQENGKTQDHIAVEEMKKIDGQWKVFNEYN